MCDGTAQIPRATGAEGADGYVARSERTTTSILEAFDDLAGRGRELRALLEVVDPYAGIDEHPLVLTGKLEELIACAQSQRPGQHARAHAGIECPGPCPRTRSSA